VSSILDALRKLEAAEAPAARAPVAVTERPRARGLTAAGIALAFVAGAGLTLFLRGGGTTAPPAPVASAKPQPVTAPAPPAPPEPTPAPPAIEPAPPPPSPPVAEALPPAAPAPPLPQATVDAEPPRARVAAVAPPPAAPSAPVERRTEPPAAMARDAEPPPPPPTPQPAEIAPPAADSAPPPLEVLPRLPADAPHVQVSFLLYSRTPERRTVMLSIDGSGMATLHEGDRAGDIEVARILADGVHVRWGGRLFSVQARD